MSSPGQLCRPPRASARPAVSAQVLPDAADHVGALKEPDRPVIIVNHNGGCLGGRLADDPQPDRAKPRLAFFQLKSLETVLKRPDKASPSAPSLQANKTKKNLSTPRCLWVEAAGVKDAVLTSSRFAGQ